MNWIVTYWHLVHSFNSLRFILNLWLWILWLIYMLSIHLTTVVSISETFSLTLLQLLFLIIQVWLMIFQRTLRLFRTIALIRFTKIISGKWCFAHSFIFFFYLSEKHVSFSAQVLHLLFHFPKFHSLFSYKSKLWSITWGLTNSRWHLVIIIGTSSK